MDKSVGHWGIHVLKQGNNLQNFKNHSQLINFYFMIIFWSTFSSFQGPRSCFLINSIFSWVIGEVLWLKVSTVDAANAWNRGIPCRNLKITHNYLISYFITIFWLTLSSFQGRSWLHGWQFYPSDPTSYSRKTLIIQISTLWILIWWES